MRHFFQPNIASRGRLMRGGMAVLLFIAGGVIACDVFWLGLLVIGIGVFTLFEAVRGWCVARACGIKTKI